VPQAAQSVLSQKAKEGIAVAWKRRLMK